VSVLFLYLRLAFATAVVLAPGWLVARSLGVRSVSATLAWSLVVVFAALAVTFALGSTLTLTLVLLVTLGFAAFVLGARRGWPRAEGVPGRGIALFWGGIVGVIIWVSAPMVQGDGLFHLARVRKLLDLDGLSHDRVSEFADGSLHPGYAFPLWHGFIALVAKVAHEDAERVVTHLPSILAPLAVVMAFEAGWALFRHKIPTIFFIIAATALTLLSMIKKFSLIPMLGLISCLYLMAQLGITNWSRFAVWLIVGLAIYFVYSRKASKLAARGR